MNTKNLINNLFAEAGITVNGTNPWDIVVHNEQFYNQMLKNAELELGQTYMDKWWDCQNVDQFICKILSGGLEEKIYSILPFWPSMMRQWTYEFLHRVVNYQSKKKSFEVGKQHYDIGNDIYQAMLDKRMVYTCGDWDGAKNVDEAQERKFKIICEKLDLQPGMTVLDVGCGWGSFAKYAAEKHNVSVVGITISKEQIELGKKLCSGLPIELRFEDYRDLLKRNVKYDRVISLGMFEHVGYKNYQLYMKIMSACLKNDGLFLLHTIGTNSANRSTNLWIEKYIFPNGQLPSIDRIASAFGKYFIMEDWQNYGVHYDKTLMAWHHNINAHWDQLNRKYDERFQRMWNYYLLSCAGSFRARSNQLWEILLSKKGLPGGYKHTREEV